MEQSLIQKLPFDIFKFLTVRRNCSHDEVKRVTNVAEALSYTAKQVEFPAYMAISNITLKIIRQIAADIGGKLTVKLNFLSDEQEINIKGEKIIRISINLLSFCLN